MSAPRSVNPSLAHVTRAMSILVVGILGCTAPDPVSPPGARVDARGSHDTTAEAAGFGSGSFYPLSIGNSWAYRGDGSLYRVRDGVPGEPELVYAFTEERRLIGTTQHEGTSYFVEEQTHGQIPEADDPSMKWWLRIRQDKTGLYNLDTLLSNPPTPEAATVLPFHRGQDASITLAALRQSNRATPALERLAERLDRAREAARGFAQFASRTSSGLELTQLVYPLKEGASWSIRPDFPWPARVDRMESLDTPAGRITSYRIETNPGGTSIHEGEWLRLWWSRVGFVGYSLHLQSEQTDPNGDPTGEIYVADESMIATSISISSR